MKMLLKKLFGISSTKKLTRFYILVHVFRAGEFIGQYVHEIPGLPEEIAGIVARIDPRTARNVQIDCRTGTTHPPRPSLVEGYNNDVELRVMQIYSV